MFDFLKNLVNSSPIVTPNTQRQQANINAMNAVSDFQNYLKGNLTTNDFSQPSLDMINKIGADKVAEGVGQGLNNGIPEIASWIDQYNNGVGKNNPLGVQQQAPAQAQNPILTGNASQQADPKTNLMNALSSLKAGYDENVSTKFDPKNLFNNKIATQVESPSQDLVNYQNTLRQKGIDENIINAVAQGKNSGNKDIANWISQNPDALKPVMQTQYKDKNIMNRIGEGLGTVMRFADSPLGKGLIVGGLVGATGGNPAQMLGYGIQTGAKAQNVQMRNQLYRQKLKSLGYTDQDLEKIKGYIGGDEYKTISDGMYKQGMLDYRDMLLQNQKDKLQADIDYKNNSLAIKKGMLGVAQQNANTSKRKADAYIALAKNGGASGKPPGAKGSGGKNPMYGKQLAEYNQILQSGDKNKIMYARNKFMEIYGEDPDKSLKQDNDILQLIEALGNE